MNDWSRHMLQAQLRRALTRFNALEQEVAKLYLRIDGGYDLSIAEIAAILKRTPEEIQFIRDKIMDYLEGMELLHALPFPRPRTQH